METKDKIILGDLLDFIHSIEGSLQGIGFGDYRNDRERMIEVVSYFEELVNFYNRLDHVLQSLYPKIPWDKLKTMNELLIPTNDSGIDEEAVWKTAKGILPDIKKSIINYMDA